MTNLSDRYISRPEGVIQDLARKVALQYIQGLYSALTATVVVGEEPPGFFHITDGLETVMGMLGDEGYTEVLEITLQQLHVQKTGA